MFIVFLIFFLQLANGSTYLLSSLFFLQEQGVAGMPRPPGAIPPPHPAGGVSSGVGPNQGSGPPPGYVGNQQQAAMMKQMMAMEQEKRVQMHMMEQQKQQLIREQRQQQQQQLLAEQVSATQSERARPHRRASQQDTKRQKDRIKALACCKGGSNTVYILLEKIYY